MYFFSLSQCIQNALVEVEFYFSMLSGGYLFEHQKSTSTEKKKINNTAL